MTVRYFGALARRVTIFALNIFERINDRTSSTARQRLQL